MYLCQILFLLVLSFSLFSITPSQAQTTVLQRSYPKREVRAVWVATVRGMHWPKSNDVEVQKRELAAIFQKIKKANMNTVFLQVRARGDLLYPSQYEPWAQSLTGVLGKNPGYDPLKFAIEEAHRLGLELHAWWNVCKVADGPERPPMTTPKHVVNYRLEWSRLWINRDRNEKASSSEWWLDMGIPPVRSYLITVAMEMIRNYDIDGIHFDYLRYPGIEFEDDITYERFGKGMSKADWRRENINQFVRALYDSAIAVKPMLKVGSAPIGIYKNIPGAEGWQAYAVLFQDAREWLKEEKHDYLAPQIYWGIQDNPKFHLLVHDWQENSYRRHIYAGVAAYKSNVLKEILAIIDSTRAAGAMGNCFFSYEDLGNFDVFGDRYKYSANIPSMPWKDNIPPNPPSNLAVSETTPGKFLLRWKSPPKASDGDTAKYYNVYRAPYSSIDISDPSNLISITANAETTFVDEIQKPLAPRYFYHVTALDKGNIESLPSNVATVVIAEVLALAERLQPDIVLAQNFPNPVKKETFIAYELRQPAQVLLTLSKRGTLISTLVNEMQKPGRYVVLLDASTLSERNYLYTLQVGKQSISKTLTAEK